MDYYKKIFDLNMIAELHKEGAIVNGTEGGLLLGPPHSENGIYFLVKYGDVYVLEGEAEGYEYIISPNVNLDGFDHINNRIRDLSFNFNGKEDFSEIKVIDARTPDKLKFKSKYVLFDSFGFSIVNKNSTKRFLNELEVMNKKRVTTTYKNNGGYITPTKDSNINKLWCKLKRFWH